MKPSPCGTTPRLIFDTTTVDGNDTVTVNNVNTTQNNTNLTIDTGVGTDLVNIAGPLALAGNRR